MPEPYAVRLVTPQDAESYLACHVDCLAETYVDLMPPEFAELHRSEAPAEARRLRERLAALVGGAGSHDGRWLARDSSGEVVGIVHSSPGTQDWEDALDAPPTTVGYQLNHLYTRRRTHGTGLGRQLLQVALPEQATYLWILHGNARADAFYRRHGFAPDGDEMTCGASWFFRTMYRMVRPAQGASSTGPASIATRNRAYG